MKYRDAVEEDMPNLVNDASYCRRLLRVVASDADRWYDALCLMRFLFVYQLAIWIIWL